MENNISKTIYFCPSTKKDIVELDSIRKIIGVIESNSSLKIEICPTWIDLMLLLQSSDKRLENLLIVFRYDFLERANLEIDEILSMLTTLTNFVAETKKINIAVVVHKKLTREEVGKLKRNNVLGIIPASRFFSLDDAIASYKVLENGLSNWPSIIMADPILRACPKTGRNVKLTNRQYEVFRLISLRGLSNKKIGKALNISEATVKIHVSAILKVYGVSNRTQLILSNNTGPVGVK